MRYGIVIQFFPDKGFGFIRPDRGGDIFFHVTAIENCPSPPQLQFGQPVKYELVPGTEPKSPRRRSRLDDDEEEVKPAVTKSPQAQKVELIDKIPGGILDDTSQTRHVSHPNAKRRKPTWRR